jgi:hypothetical protein
MTHPLTMAPRHPRYQLLEKVPRLVFSKPTRFHDAIEELSSGSVLHRDSQVCGRQENLFETDDVGVARQLPVVDDLPLDVFIDLHGVVCCFVENSIGDRGGKIARRWDE